MRHCTLIDLLYRLISLGCQPASPSFDARAPHKMHPSQLPRELVVLIFGHLADLHVAPDALAEGQQRSPLLTAQAAAAVAAAASVHTWWRAACLAEVGLTIGVFSLDEECSRERIFTFPLPICSPPAGAMPHPPRLPRRCGAPGCRPRPALLRAAPAAAASS